MIMQVHDELVLEVPLDQVDEIIKAVKKIMRQATELSIPLVRLCNKRRLTHY